MRIELDRCIVRSFARGDAASLARYADNRAVWRNLRDAFPHPYRVADARRFLRRTIGAEPETVFAIEVEGEAAGGIGLRLHGDVERVSAELGYWLGEPFWGRGIVTEAVRAVTDLAFARHGLTRVYALPFEWNPASCRVLEKAGFVLEARLRKCAIKDGRVIDQFLYARVVDDVVPAERARPRS